jgi:predicted ATP-dependent Lon-type protease
MTTETTDMIEQATNDITKDILNYWEKYPNKFTRTLDAYNIVDTYIIEYMHDLRKNVYMNILNNDDIDDILKRATD